VCYRYERTRTYSEYVQQIYLLPACAFLCPKPVCPAVGRRHVEYRPKVVVRANFFPPIQAFLSTVSFIHHASSRRLDLLPNFSERTNTNTNTNTPHWYYTTPSHNDDTGPRPVSLFDSLVNQPQNARNEAKEDGNQSLV
jgi:hypothetical protein